MSKSTFERKARAAGYTRREINYWVAGGYKRYKTVPLNFPGTHRKSTSGTADSEHSSMHMAMTLNERSVAAGSNDGTSMPKPYEHENLAGTHAVVQAVGEGKLPVGGALFGVGIPIHWSWNPGPMGRVTKKFKRREKEYDKNPGKTLKVDSAATVNGNIKHYTQHEAGVVIHWAGLDDTGQIGPKLISTDGCPGTDKRTTGWIATRRVKFSAGWGPVSVTYYLTVHYSGCAWGWYTESGGGGIG